MSVYQDPPVPDAGMRFQVFGNKKMVTDRDLGLNAYSSHVRLRVGTPKLGCC